MQDIWAELEWCYAAVWVVSIMNEVRNEATYISNKYKLK